MDRPVNTTEWYRRDCDICGETNEIRTLSERSEKAYTRNQIFIMEFVDAVCENCRFVFSRAVPSDSFLFEYYSDGFNYQSEHIDINPDYDEEARIDTIKQHISGRSKIAEVGASTGEFCETLRKRGFQAKGIDPIAYDEGDVTTAFVGKDDTLDDTYDAIVSYYVLEHVTDTNKWLTEVTDTLSEGGIIILEVPNFQEYPRESLINEHFSHFTPTHLKSLLKKNGIAPLNINKEDTSRYFGVEIVGKYIGDSGKRFSKESHWDISDAIECYEEGQEEKRKMKHHCKSIAEKIKQSRPSDTTQIYFWAANDYATDIANNLDTNKTYIFDNDSSRIGTKHPGFPHPIRPPEFEKNTDNHRIFVLCSPAWNDDIKKQIKNMELKDITIIDGTELE